VGKVINSWEKLRGWESSRRQSDVNGLEEQINQLPLGKEKIRVLVKRSQSVEISISNTFLVHSGQRAAAHCDLRDRKKESAGVNKSCGCVNEKRQSFLLSIGGRSPTGVTIIMFGRRGKLSVIFV
jgi:hypothetical protein